MHKIQIGGRIIFLPPIPNLLAGEDLSEIRLRVPDHRALRTLAMHQFVVRPDAGLDLGPLIRVLDRTEFLIEHHGAVLILRIKQFQSLDKSRINVHATTTGRTLDLTRLNLGSHSFSPPFGVLVELVGRTIHEDYEPVKP